MKMKRHETLTRSESKQGRMGKRKRGLWAAH